MLNAFLPATTTLPEVVQSNDYENENPDPVVAMQEALDEYGDFSLIANGSLSWDGTQACHKILMRQGSRAFIPKENELIEKRMEFFKTRDNKKYTEVVVEMMKKRQEEFTKMSKEIEEYLEMDEGTFDASMEYWSEFPEKKKLLGEIARLEKMKSKPK
jgi:hypothetical protein